MVSAAIFIRVNEILTIAAFSWKSLAVQPRKEVNLHGEFDRYPVV